MTDWMFPTGVLGVDLRGCDCDECIASVLAYQVAETDIRATAVNIDAADAGSANFPPGDHTRGQRHGRVWTTVEHFGEQVRSGKYGHRLTREQYALPNKTPSIRIDRALVSQRQWGAEEWAFEDEDHTVLSDAFCSQQREQALENFDLNMAFFSQIPWSDFEDALAEMSRKNRRLRPVTDLRTLDGVEGVYVMVLDDYRQVYIGQSGDIRARIKRHWTGTKAFDRLLWGSPHESVLSIDSFRSLDTTRIFAARTTGRDSMEKRLVRTFPQSYTMNRIGGGRPDEFRLLLLEAERKRRQLLSQTEVTEVAGEQRD